MYRLFISLIAAIGVSACNSTPEMKPIEPEAKIDLQRFMGDWYVIAHIPTFMEKSAFNAIESYTLNTDGTIATTFTFNKGALDGPPKRSTPKGFVREGTANAVWGMQFIWPIKAEYIIAHVKDDYSQTIVARNKRDYVWIMARSPTLAPNDYDNLVEQVRSMGYDLTLLRRVPHAKP